MSMHADDEHLKESSPCPLCGEPLVIRHSAHGDFLGCSNYPECSFLKPIVATHTVVSLGEVGAPCPRCGEPLLVKKVVLVFLLAVRTIQSATMFIILKKV